MFKKIFLAFLLAQLSVLVASAQTLRVTGRVLDDSSNTGLPNVSVVVTETKKGVSTDNDGNFTINVTGRSSVTLTASYVGYKPATVKTDGSRPVTITLSKEQSQLDDVVVIGYQTVKRKDVLASVSSVGARELKDIPINSAAEALNGRLAGVTAITSEGSPDAEVRVRVRGGMSITGDNSPLYIVDGVQVEEGLSTIAPQNIQSIDVLKDAAATAIYGARGANGVIIITTKSGRPGRMVVSYNGFIGVKKLAKKLKVLSPYEYVIYQSERSRGSTTDSTNFTENFGTTWDTLQNYKNVPAVNWQDEVFGRTGIMQTHVVSAMGGNKKITYNFGYTLNDEKAIVLNSKYQRHLFNLKGDYKITKNLKVGISSRYTLQNVYGAGVSSDQGTAYNRLRNAVKYRPFLSEDQTIDDEDPLADPNVGNGLTLVNPIQLVDAEYRQKTTDAYNVTLNANYQITKRLSFRTTFGYDRNKVTDRKFYDTIAPYSVIQGGRLPIVGLDTTDRSIITNSNVFSYSLKNIKTNHDLDFLVGQETYDMRVERRNSLFRDYPVTVSHDQAFNETNLGTPFAGYPRINKIRYTSLSFFGRINYSYKDKYLVTVNARADGASKFAPELRWGYFPAGSVAWRVSKENFMENVDFINDLKFRVGYGAIGNNRIDDYLYLSTFSDNGSRYYGINGQPVIGYVPVSLPNRKLKWESTINRNYGMDITLFKNRLDLSVDYYNNSSKDLLLFVPIDPTYGFSEQYQNVGKTSNKGIEVQLNATILRKPNNFNWTANFNISHNKNTVVALGPGQEFFYPAASWGVSGQPTDYIVKIGDPVGSMYGLVNDGFYTVDDFNYNPATMVYSLKPGIVTNTSIIGTVQPGSVKFKDLNGDGKIEVDNDRKIIGNPTPDFSGGLNQQLTYKNWDMSLFVNFIVGSDIYNANKIEFTNGYTNYANMIDIMENRWRVVTPDGRTAQWVTGSGSNAIVYGIAPDQLSALNANATIWQPLRGAGAFYPSSWAIEDGSFLRINNLTIGYTLPVKAVTRLKMSKLRFYFTGNNLAVFTNYSGYDPEVSVRRLALTPNLDYSAYPRSRTFIFGINATF